MRPTMLKGLWTGLVGQSRTKFFKRLNQDSLKDFTMRASHLIQSITRLYLPKKDIFEELAGIETAPCTKSTLDVHKVKRKINEQSIIFLEFYRLSFDQKPFYTLFYRKSSDIIVCGQEFSSDRNWKTACFLLLVSLPIAF